MLARLYRFKPNAFLWIKLVQFLFCLNSGIWLLFGVLSLARLVSVRGSKLTFLVVSVLMFFNAGNVQLVWR